MNKVQKSMIHLLSNEGVFYASLLSQMRITDSETCLPKEALAAVSVQNGRIHLMVNSVLMEPYSIEQVAHILEHECLPAGTFLTGVNKPIEAVEVGDQVIDRDGKFTRVNHIMKRKYTGEMYTVKAGGILPFELTYNHPLLVAEYKRKSFNKKASTGKMCTFHEREFSEPKMVRADHLKACNKKEGQYLLVPKYEKKSFGDTVDMSPFVKSDNGCIKNVDLALDEELAFTLGFYTAKGSYNEDKSGSVLMSFTCHKEKDVESIKRVQAFLKKNGYESRVYTKEEDFVARVCTNSSILGRSFSAWCGSGAHNKKIPDFILYNENEKLIRSYLEGFLAGDGCTWKNYKILNTVSKTLIYQLQLAILNLGESAAVTVKEDNTSALVKNASSLYGIEWRDKSHSMIRDLGKFYGLPIRKVTHRAYEGDVFNCETATHTYSVHNIISSNCLHLVLEHLGRMENRNGYIWNLATDCSINSIIDGWDIKGTCMPGKEGFSDFPSKKTADFYYALLRDKVDKMEVTFNIDGSVTVKDGKTGKSVTFKPSPGSHKDWEKSSASAAEGLAREVIKQAVAEAYQQAKQAGKFPGGIKELIEELLGKEKFNWKQLLRQYIGNQVKAGSRQTWKRESKRFGVTQKGKSKNRIIKLGIGIDTSGSISTYDFQEFMTEVRGIMSAYKTDITIVECDADIQRHYTLKKYMKIKPDFKGRGGTDFNPFFKFFLEGEGKASRPELLIIFTDAYGPYPDKEPMKTLWVITSSSDIKEMKWGKVINIPREDKRGN